MNVSPFHPTHTVPAGGLDARSQADPNQPPVARLDPWLDVEVLRVWGAWAEISCSNGWTAWVDARVLLAKASPVMAPPPALLLPVEAPVQPVEVPSMFGSEAPAEAPTVEVPSMFGSEAPAVEEPTVEVPSMFGSEAPAETPTVDAAQPSRTYEQAPTPQAPIDVPPVVAQTMQVPTAAPPSAPAYTQPPPPAYTQPPPPAVGQYTAAYPQPGASAPAARKLPVPAIVGGAIAALSGFAPWLRAGSASSKGFDVPAKFLIDYKTSGSGGLEIGLVVLLLGVVGAVLAALPGMGVLRRICGWACVVAGALYIVQMQRLLSAFTGSPKLVDTIGIGVLAAVAGGLVLALSPDASR